MKEKSIWLRVLILVVLLCAASGKLETNEGDDSDPKTAEEARAEETSEQTPRAPTVFLAILARNTAHTLPYFFSYIDKLDYPKDRMYIW